MGVHFLHWALDLRFEIERYTFVSGSLIDDRQHKPFLACRRVTSLSQCLIAERMNKEYSAWFTLLTLVILLGLTAVRGTFNQDNHVQQSPNRTEKCM